MPDVDWDTIEDADSYTIYPDGEYLSKCSEIETKQTKNGHEMWQLEFTIVRGDRPELDKYKGKTFRDNITFSPDGMKRVKLVASRLGFKTAGKGAIEKKDLIGRSAWITLTQGSFWSEKKQKEMKKNDVPFAGYRAAEPQESTPSEAQDAVEPIPF